MSYKVMYLVKTYNIHATLVVNIDQTGFHATLMVNSAHSKLHILPITWENKGAKHIKVSWLKTINLRNLLFRHLWMDYSWVQMG
jgi:hypothetical protein